MDINAEFEVEKEVLERVVESKSVHESSVVYGCEGNGAANRGALGPFGLSVLAHQDLSEHTPVYFYIAKGSDNNLKTFFCADQSRLDRSS